MGKSLRPIIPPKAGRFATRGHSIAIAVPSTVRQRLARKCVRGEDEGLSRVSVLGIPITISRAFFLEISDRRRFVARRRRCVIQRGILAQVRAFPTAEGFGALATGGRGGAIYHVTNLNDSGAGSFRDAVSVGNRIVVFDVGGYINLLSECAVQNNITIAGQTAPGGGIGFTGAEVSMGQKSNIIVRHVRFRPGDTATSTANGVNMYRGQNIVLDHVSVEFAPWNNLSAVGDGTRDATNITVQNSIIANPINQQFGAHMESLGDSMTMSNNLWANGHNRQPMAKINMQYKNNVVYNYQAGYTTANTSGVFSHDIVNNYFITGPATTSPGNAFYQINANQSYYLVGNSRDSNNDGVLNGSGTNPSGGTTLVPPVGPFDAGATDAFDCRGLQPCADICRRYAAQSR